jgi:hypothetical protein
MNLGVESKARPTKPVRPRRLRTLDCSYLNWRRIGFHLRLQGGTVMVREKEWGRALARQLASELPAAVRDLPELRLTSQQIDQLRVAFENRLIVTMGEDTGETPSAAVPRTAKKTS